MSRHIYDCVIIGAGPAGLGAAIYAARAGFDVLVVEKNPLAGGQIVNTTEVDNYLGLPGIGGFEMGQTFRSHAEKLGVPFLNATVLEIEIGDEYKTIHLENGDELYSYTIVLAMGAHHSLLNVPGEKEYTGRGVSYCATCDGAFFRKRNVVVVGGGDVAVGDALFLSGLCEHVTLIHRRDSLRASMSLQDALMKKENCEILWNTVAVEVKGDDLVNGFLCKNVISGESFTIDAAGVFVAVGMEPESMLVRDILDVDDRGYIRAGEDCVTNVPGIYAAGDIRTKKLRQVITAVADGASAISSCEEYLINIKKK